MCWTKPSSRPSPRWRFRLNHPQSLAFASKFVTDATSNGTLRKAYDNNGLKDTPIRTATK